MFMSLAIKMKTMKRRLIRNAVCSIQFAGLLEIRRKTMIPFFLIKVKHWSPKLT